MFVALAKGSRDPEGCRGPAVLLEGGSWSSGGARDLLAGGKYGAYGTVSSELLLMMRDWGMSVGMLMGGGDAMGPIRKVYPGKQEADSKPGG
jgi:hypothetical protein